MPDPKKKTVVPNAEKYKGKDPLKEGYKELTKVDNKTYYDKEAEKAISGGLPGADWEKKIQGMAASGVSPEELVKAGHISASQMDKFRPFYKQVYTETPPVVVPKTTVVDPAIGARANMKLLGKNSAGQLWDTYEVSDLDGQVNKSKQVQVYKGKILDNNKLLQTGDPSLSMTDEDFQDTRNTNVRSDAQGMTNLPTQINGVPVTGNTTGYTDPLLMKPKGDKAGTVSSSTGDGFKHGGLIKKIKGYADGGETSDNSKQVAAIAGMGAGIAGELGGQALDNKFMDEQGRYIRDPEMDPNSVQGVASKFYNKGTLAGGVKGAGRGAALGANLGPEGALIGAGVGLLAGSVTGTLKANKDAKSIRADFDAVNQQNILEEQAQKQAVIDASLNKQLTDRAQGLKNGGKVEGRGTSKSDSITAKVKKNSFVVPAKNAAKAELVRKVVLKAPIVKANLKQGDGEKVKLSNGEHLFTPEEYAEIKANGIDIDALAPDAKNNLRTHLNCGGKVKGYKDGGKTYKPTESEKEYYRKKYGTNYKPSNEELEYLNKTYSKKSAPTYYSKKKEVITPDQLERINTALDVPNNDVEALLSQDAGTNNMGERTAPLPSSQAAPINAPRGGLAGKFSMSDVNKAIEMGIPLAQIGFGLSQLRKQGKRPVDELDKDYLDTIQKARMGVDTANANAKYGFTPEEAALLSQENQNLTNAQRYTAKNLAGGSASNAYNMERNAINNSFGRGLRAKVENANLKLQKQGIAQDKQAYLDSLIGNKTEMSRRLFNDKMNAFTQNQTAGGNLVGAGIKNYLGGQRYNAELAAMKNTANIENSWMEGLGK